MLRGEGQGAGGAQSGHCTRPQAFWEGCLEEVRPKARTGEEKGLSRAKFQGRATWHGMK